MLSKYGLVLLAVLMAPTSFAAMVPRQETSSSTSPTTSLPSTSSAPTPTTTVGFSTTGNLLYFVLSEPIANKMSRFANFCRCCVHTSGSIHHDHQCLCPAIRVRGKQWKSYYDRSVWLIPSSDGYCYWQFNQSKLNTTTGRLQCCYLRIEWYRGSILSSSKRNSLDTKYFLSSDLGPKLLACLYW